MDLKIRVHSDATAAIGIAKRRGLGRIRHLHTADLWVQEKIRNGHVELLKIAGKENPADLFIKHLSSREWVQKLVALLGCRYTGGRAESARSGE